MSLVQMKGKFIKCKIPAEKIMGLVSPKSDSASEVSEIVNVEKYKLNTKTI